jgi:hypothetical protein
VIKFLNALIVFNLMVMIVLLTLRCSLAQESKEYIVKGGTSIVDGAPSGETKYFGIRKEEKEAFGLYSGSEVGAWIDNSSNKGQRSSLIAKAQIGVKPGPMVGVYGKVFTGIAVISSPDSLLGSVPQFATDFGIGVRDTTSSIGIGYSHVSNAGLFSPVNRGRDFVTIEAGLLF